MAEKKKKLKAKAKLKANTKASSDTKGEHTFTSKPRHRGGMGKLGTKKEKISGYGYTGPDPEAYVEYDRPHRRSYKAGNPWDEGAGKKAAAKASLKKKAKPKSASKKSSKSKKK